MKLILQNGYPFPLPAGFDSDTYECRDNSLTLEDVVHFEWKHTVTVEFRSANAATAAKQLTDWTYWDSPRILEAETNGPEGYGHPAIIVKGMAYCGFVLLAGGRL
jgi:hypothetical protein